MTYGDGQVVASSQLGNLTDASERGTHDDGLVSKLLVVVEDVLDRLNSWVLFLGVCLAGLGLVPIQDTANERRNQVGIGLSSGNSLDLRKQESEVTVDAVLLLEDTGSLDTFPGGSDLDQDAGLVDTDSFVELQSFP